MDKIVTSEPLKWLVVGVFSTLGLVVDVEPVIIFFKLWMMDLGLRLFKNLIVYRTLNGWESMRKSAMYMSLPSVPVVVMIWASQWNPEYMLGYKMVMWMISLFLVITSISSVTTLFTRKEYEHDQLIGHSLESLIKDLKARFKKKP